MTEPTPMSLSRETGWTLATWEEAQNVLGPRWARLAPAVAGVSARMGVSPVEAAAMVAEVDAVMSEL